MSSINACLGLGDSITIRPVDDLRGMQPEMKPQVIDDGLPEPLPAPAEGVTLPDINKSVRQLSTGAWKAMQESFDSTDRAPTSQQPSSHVCNWFARNTGMPMDMIDMSFSNQWHNPKAVTSGYEDNGHERQGYQPPQDSAAIFGISNIDIKKGGNCMPHGLFLNGRAPPPRNRNSAQAVDTFQPTYLQLMGGVFTFGIPFRA